MKELMGNLEKCTLNLKNIEQDYENLKDKYCILDCKYRDDQLVFKR